MLLSNQDRRASLRKRPRAAILHTRSSLHKKTVPTTESSLDSEDELSVSGYNDISVNRNRRSLGTRASKGKKTKGPVELSEDELLG